MVLELLREESPRDLATLAEEVAVAETGSRPPPRNKRQSAYTTLHQTHLPKLDALDIVDYDTREKVVYLDAMAERVLVEHDGERETDPAVTWPEAVLGAVVAGLVTAVASALGVPLLRAVPWGAYAVATLVVLLAVLAYRVGRDGSQALARLRDRLD